MAVKRAYSSVRRQAQARETRQSILDAALELFVASGYAARSIQAIAERAAVAVQTVYAVFGTKRELLRQLIESTITGDDHPSPSRSGTRPRRSPPNPTPVGGPNSTRA